jgi:integrase/recombinase XerD
MSRVQKGVVTGPLAELVADVEARLAGLGYVPSTRQAMVGVIVQLSGWLEVRRACLPELTRELIEQFVDEQRSGGRGSPAVSASRLLAILSLAGVLPNDPQEPPVSPREALLDRFGGFLREERGLSVLTVQAYVCDVRRFLDRCGCSDLRDLSASHVSSAVLAEIAGRSPATVRRYGVSLRSFLRYCHLSGLIGSDLSESALPVSGRRRSLLPKGLSDSQMTSLLSCCDRRRASGRRDYAVILVMSRLGLRATEVATLRLDDIDWRAGVITVRGKFSRVDQIPLPVDVAQAIIGYLQRGRPSTSAREVFLRSLAPRVALTRGGVSNIVLDASRRAGLEPVRAHRLRHTAACQMLRAGATPAQIGQVLRHHSAGATAAYARVDVERLRMVARPWPTTGASS